MSGRINITPEGPLFPEALSIHDHELEKTVLAALMSNFHSLESVNDILNAECFHGLKNREIYLAIAALYERGERPDTLLVSDELKKNGSDISGIELLQMCAETTVAADISQHCLILLDYAKRRKLWNTGYMLMCGAGDKAKPIDLTHSEAKEAIDGLFDDSRNQTTTLRETYEELERIMVENNSRPEGEIYGTPTGFTEIDRNGGLCGSDLIVVGAETSQGKTSFATALAVSAVKNGDPVAFYSMEMTPVQLTARIAAMQSGLSSSKIQYSRMDETDIYRIGNVMRSFDTGLMHFDGNSTSSLERIKTSIRSMKARHGIKGAVVDYLQLVNTAERGLNTEQMTAKCARDLKNLAKELDIWIIAISQLSRNPGNPLPSLSRLRSSGQIEEAADNIFLIYRPRKGNYPEPFTDVNPQGTAMVSIAKGRNVGTGEFICGFNGESTYFYPLEEIPKGFGRASYSTETEDPF